MHDDTDTGADGAESPPIVSPLVFTHFPRIDRPRGVSQTCTWDDVVDTLRGAQEFDSKVAMPLFRLARFRDDHATKSNLLEIYGILVDYDAGHYTMSDAAQACADYGVEALFYSTPSSTAAAPRWRGVFPLSRVYPASAHADLVDLANGILFGALARESWVTAQRFYYGCVQGIPYHVQQVRGVAIDSVGDRIPRRPRPRVDDLDRDDDDSAGAGGGGAQVSIPGLPAAAAARTADRAGARKSLAPDVVVHLRGALRCLNPDDYLIWLNLVGVALHPYGRQGYEIWATWSQTCSPEKFADERELKYKWDSIHDDKGAQNADVASIFAAAQRAGWVNPAAALSVEAERRERELREVYEQAVERASRRVEVKPERDVVARPLPVAALEALRLWVEREHADARTHPLATLGAVLSVASLCASRYYVADDGGPLPLQIVMVAPNAAWPSYATTAADTVAGAVGAGAAVHLERLATAPALFGALAKTPSMLYAPQDWGAQLQFAGRQSSGALAAVLQYIARPLADGRDMRLEGWTDFGAGNARRAESRAPLERPVICKPCLTLLGTVAGAQGATLLKSHEIDRGALDPLLVLPMQAPHAWRAVARRREVERAVSADVVGRARAVMQIQTPAGSALPENPFDGLYAMQPIARRVSTNCPALDAAADRVREFGARVAAGGRDATVLETFVGGALRNLKRMACILAAWDDPQAPAVRAAHVEWAEWLIAESLLALIDDYDLRGAAEEEKASVYDMVLEAIKRAGPAGVTRRDLAKSSKPFRNLGDDGRRQTMIDDMIATGLVEEIAAPATGAAGGRPKALLVYAAYATVAECKPQTAKTPALAPK